MWLYACMMSTLTMMNSDRWISFISSLSMFLTWNQTKSFSVRPDVAGRGLWALQCDWQSWARRVSVSSLQASVSWRRALSVWRHHRSLYQYHKANLQRSDQVRVVKSPGPSNLFTHVIPAWWSNNETVYPLLCSVQKDPETKKISVVSTVLKVSVHVSYWLKFMYIWLKSKRFGHVDTF